MTRLTCLCARERVSVCVCVCGCVLLLLLLQLRSMARMLLRPARPFARVTQFFEFFSCYHDDVCGVDGVPAVLLACVAHVRMPYIVLLQCLVVPLCVYQYRVSGVCVCALCFVVHVRVLIYVRVPFVSTWFFCMSFPSRAKERKKAGNRHSTRISCIER